MMKKELYTQHQMQQLLDMVIRSLPQQECDAPANLDNETEQCSLSPCSKLTCTVSEAAQMLGVSKPIMYDLVRAGAVPSFRVGRKILMSRKTLSDWVENGGKYGKETC